MGREGPFDYNPNCKNMGGFDYIEIKDIFKQLRPPINKDAKQDEVFMISKNGKGLISRIYKELLQSYKKTGNNKKYDQRM
jgi:hypothetical protein